MNKKSGFAYQPGGHPEYTTTAAGLLAMQVCGEYESFVKGAADWLLENEPNTSRKFFYYGTYYYSQAMYQRGGDHAKEAREKVEESSRSCKGKTVRGKAPDRREGAGEIYSTTMAVLALAVKSITTFPFTKGRSQPSGPSVQPVLPDRIAPLDCLGSSSDKVDMNFRQSSTQGS